MIHFDFSPNLFEPEKLQVVFTATFSDKKSTGQFSASSEDLLFTLALCVKQQMLKGVHEGISHFLRVHPFYIPKQKSDLDKISYFLKTNHADAPIDVFAARYLEFCHPFMQSLFNIPSSPFYTAWQFRVNKLHDYAHMLAANGDMLIMAAPGEAKALPSNISNEQACVSPTMQK